MKSFKYIIGIDEVGRGPVAGPVAVGALIVAKGNMKKVVEMFSNFKDSKKLTPKKRNEWFLNIKQAKKDGLLDYKIIFVDNKQIDKNGIVPSIRACINKSLEALCSMSSVIQKSGESDSSLGECLVLLDGGLKAPEEFVNQKTIIKGDEKELVIALASIVAKVTRDALMCKLAKEYSQYGFEKHKGYGTKVHMEAIKSYGLCKIHRKTYLKNLLSSSATK